MNTKQSYLYDKETGLYNRTVVDAFVAKCNNTALFPLSLILFEIKPSNPEIQNSELMSQFAQIFKNNQNNRIFTARFSNSKIIVFISKCNSNSAFKFTENIAKQVNDCNLLENSVVNVVFSEWKDLNPPDASFLSEIEKLLHTSQRINLSYII